MLDLWTIIWPFVVSDRKFKKNSYSENDMLFTGIKIYTVKICLPAAFLYDTGLLSNNSKIDRDQTIETFSSRSSNSKIYLYLKFSKRLLPEM